MKKFVTVAALGVALAVAGCGKSDDAGKAGDTADAGKTESTAAAGPVKREPGNWKTEVKLVKFDMPGAPAAMKDQMAKQFASAGSTETCLTQEQADQEDLANAMSKGYGDACTWSKNEIGGGKIDVAGTCTANGQKVDLAMAGTVESKKTDMTITTKTAAPTGGQMEMQMQVTNTNIGPCKA
ncbi:DUF3617 domain-containing protein [Sphingopyxis sp. NJF-3]